MVPVPGMMGVGMHMAGITSRPMSCGTSVGKPPSAQLPYVAVGAGTCQVM